MEQKMNWLASSYAKNELVYTINNTNEKKGTIVMPTGTGKSGEVYKDMIWHIENAKEDEKIVFNLSANILKLEAQFVNDLFEVFESIPKFNEMCQNGEFEFYINSSADGEVYSCENISDVNRFSYDIDKFKNSKARFAIVASCHKSLPKFAEKVDFLNSFATVINYIDEAHLVLHETRDDLEYDKLNEEGKTRYTSLEKICKSEYVYALTATPDKYVTKVINDAAGRVTDSIKSGIIIDLMARDAIASNMIIPVNTFILRVGDSDEEYKISPNICDNFMKTVKQDNPNIVHKILVTCSNTEHLNTLQTELGKMGYNTFSTCSKNGGQYLSDDEFVDIDEIEFIKEVDSFNEDCFVLHIKQLRQGIDIKTLTDCIFYNGTRVNDGVKRTILQTIGRILRPMAGERGVSYEERIKKHGNVLFLVKDSDFEDVSRQMVSFLLLYYGRDGIMAFSYDPNTNYGDRGKNKRGNFMLKTDFDDDFWNNEWFENEIQRLLINMDEYIRTQIQPKYGFFLKLQGVKNREKLIPQLYQDMKKKYYLCNGEYNTSELLTNTEFMEAVHELFKQYEID